MYKDKVKQFELNDYQRQFFGLEPIQDSWERVEFKNGLCLYFEGNEIKKVLYSYKPDSYTEYDQQIPTKDRLKIISPSKGKEKPITLTTVHSYSGNKRKASFCVEIYKDESDIDSVHLAWSIEEHVFYLENYPSIWKGLKNLAELPNRIDRFIKKLPANHHEKIKAIKNRKKKRVVKKYKCGDFFAVPFDHDLYGSPQRYFFGRHLMNINQFRKAFNLPKDHPWNHLMTVVQLVAFYDYESSSMEQDLQELKQQPYIRPIYMMDDHLFRGEYPIVGHLDLEPEELDFPMHYKKERGEGDSFSFSWGEILLSNLAPSPLAMEVLKHYDDLSFAAFNPDGVCFGMDRSLPSTDLIHPKNAKIKAEIFSKMGVSPEIDYDQFAKKFGFRTRKELLAIIH